MVRTTILYFILITLILNCQMKKELPEFHVEMSHPANEYGIEPVHDRIKTLEGN